MRISWVVISIFVLLSSVNAIGDTTHTPMVDSYNFADIPWGTPFDEACKMLGNQGFDVGAPAHESEEGSSIAFSSNAQLGFEYDVTCAFDNEMGLIAVIVMTTMDCMDASDTDCYEKRFFIAKAILTSMYGNPNGGIPQFSEKWSKSRDGSKIELNKAMGIMYESPNTKKHLRKNSIF